METQHPSLEGGGAPSPIFSPCRLWRNGWMNQDGTWRGGGPWSTTHCARWGRSSAPQKGDSLPQFSAHFYCGQTGRCSKMPLGMEVGLSPGDFVLHGDIASPPQKGAKPPIFGPCLLWPNGCMDEDATWYEGRPRPTRHCIRWGRSSPPLKWHSLPLIFGQCPLWPNGWMD